MICILLIYERAGIVSEVFRYPVKTSSGDDAFFSLPSRLIEKLFRPHPSLCGQPMSISFDNTIFCSRSVIVQDTASSITYPQNTTAAGTTGNNININESTTIGSSSSSGGNSILFSIVVALASSKSIPRSLEDDESTIMRRRNLIVGATTEVVSQRFAVNGSSSSHNNQLSSHCYTSRSDITAATSVDCSSVCSLESMDIQRVHMSLSRLCTILEREQVRCGYVSLQSKMLLKIRDEVLEKKRQQQQHQRDQLIDEYRQVTLELMLAADMQQLLLERASSDPAQQTQIQMQHGNLARDLVATFHALAAKSTLNFINIGNDSWCSYHNKETVIHVNGHLAVPIEPVSNANSMTAAKFSKINCTTEIRSYHTLLFPFAESTEDLLLYYAIKFTSITTEYYQPLRPTPQKTAGSTATMTMMHRFLTTITPFKSLNDVATELSCTLQSIIYMAEGIVNNSDHDHPCIVVPVFTENTRFACASNFYEYQKELDVAFAQRFAVGGVAITNIPHVSLVVSLLTSSEEKTLGEILNNLSDNTHDDPLTELIGIFVQCRLSALINNNKKVASSTGDNAQCLPHSRCLLDTYEISNSANNSQQLNFAIKDELCWIVAWLRGQRSIIELKDYIVAMKPLSFPDEENRNFICTKEKTTNNATNGNSSLTSLNEIDEEQQLQKQIYNDLLQLGYLNGNVSATALCWKYFCLDSKKLKHFLDWALAARKIKIVRRVQSTGDDFF